MNSMKEFRGAIDAIDEQLVELLSKRNQLVKEFWNFKFENKIELKDELRERDLLQRIRALARAQALNPDAIEVLFSHIVGKNLSAPKEGTTS
jgi:chorismate mutase